MKKISNVCLSLIVLTMGQACKDSVTGTGFVWDQLPQLPDPVGFAGAYAGVSNGHLLLGGGANFPEGTRPWSGGVKQWSDQVFALAEGSDKWQLVGRLPRPMGYGISLSWRDSVLMIGGADQLRHYRDVYVLSYKQELVIDTLPYLPEPLAYACGVMAGDTLYIAGGQRDPSATEAAHVFWAMDLSKPADERRWKILEPWPGKARMLSVAGVMNDSFFLFSGVSLEVPAGETNPRRKYLTDAYRYTPDEGWYQIRDLPSPVAAAPTPAYMGENRELLVFGGDDGSLATHNNQLQDRHPGFTTAIRAYDPTTGEWRIAGKVSTDRHPDPEQHPNASTLAPVTTPLVVWNDAIVLPSGEVRPGVRTNRILIAKQERL